MNKKNCFVKHIFITYTQNVNQFGILKNKFNVEIDILLQTQSQTLPSLIANFLEISEGNFVIIYLVTPKQKYIKELISRLPNIVATILVRDNIKTYRNLCVKYCNSYTTNKVDDIYYDMYDIDLKNPFTLTQVLSKINKLTCK